MMKRSQRNEIIDLLYLKLLGWFSCFFFDYIIFLKYSAREELIPSTILTRKSKVYLLNTMMMKNIWMWTFMIAFPIKTAEKNVLKGILKCPLVIPARSNRGLGIEAQANIAQKPYFYMLL